VDREAQPVVPAVQVADLGGGTLGALAILAARAQLGTAIGARPGVLMTTIRERYRLRSRPIVRTPWDLTLVAGGAVLLVLSALPVSAHHISAAERGKTRLTTREVLAAEQTPESGHVPPLSPSGPVDIEMIPRYELRIVGSHVLHMRTALGDEAALARIESWSDAPVPNFHKL